MAVKAGVMKFAPVNKSVPPTAASNHSYVPPGAVASKLAVVPEQIVVPAAVGAAGGWVTLTVTGVRNRVST